MKKQLLTLSLVMMSIGLFSQSTVWQPFNSNLDTLWGIRYLSVVDTNIVWAVGYNGSATNPSTNRFTHTGNGALFVAGSFLPDTNNFNASNISAVNDSVAYIPCYSKDATRAGIMMKTMDRGLTWANCVDTTTMFTTSNNFPDWAHFYTNNRGIVLGDPNGGNFEIYHTYNGGTNWTRVPNANIPSPVGTEYGVTDVFTWYGKKHLWFGTNHGGSNVVPHVYRSSDTAHTWLSSPVPGMLAGVSGLAFRDSLNGMAWGYTAVSGGKFLLKKTLNGGVTWQTVFQHNNVGTYDISAIPGQNAYLSVGLDSSGAAYITSMTTDDGNTWTVLESGITNVQRMLQVTMLDSTHGWAGCFSDTSNKPFGNNGMDKYIGPKITGISQISVNSIQVLFYPNPSNGIISVSLSNVKAGTAITISDMLGNEVYKTSINSNALNQNLSIDLSSLPKGVYLFGVSSGSQARVQKLVIQ